MDMSQYHSRLLLSESQSTNFAAFGYKIYSRIVGKGGIDFFLSHRVFFVKSRLTKNVSRCYIFLHRTLVSL